MLIEKDSFDAIVICSTLNQMVNYIAIKEHGMENKRIFNIRLKKNNNKYNCNKKFNYDKWDENLETVLKSVRGGTDSKVLCNITYGDTEISGLGNITKKLKGIINVGEFKEKRILWNITGGQRHFVMAITQYVLKERPQDVLLYIDGDTEEMYYYSGSKLEHDKKELSKTYPMTIAIALRLMGMSIKEVGLNKSQHTGGRRDLQSKSIYYEFVEKKTGKKENENLKEEKYQDIDEEYGVYLNMHKEYIKQNYLKEILIRSNTFKNSNEKGNLPILHQIFNEIEMKAPENKSTFLDCKAKKAIEKSLGNYSKGKAFGYILEKMTLYKILKEMIDNDEVFKQIADIDWSVKIVEEKNSRNEEDEERNSKAEESEERNNKTLDEFDILLVTTAGKVIMLECKSGGMTGDNAKSNNYSTYAVAGVYGTPILINPLGKRPITDAKEKELYSQILKARNAAEKAGLDIWEVDKVCEKLKNILGVN